MQLYVNLRCMKVLDDRLVLYIGGGITHDSVPEEEWEETEIKADTCFRYCNKSGKCFIQNNILQIWLKFAAGKGSAG